MRSKKADSPASTSALMPPRDTKAEAKAEDTKAPESAEGKTYSIIYLTPSTASQVWTYVGIGIENAMKDMEEKGLRLNSPPWDKLRKARQRTM